MRTLTLILLMCSITSFAQTGLNEIKLPLQNSKVTYTEIINVDSANKTELYTRAKDWIARSFKASKNVIQLDDKEDGRIALRGALDDYTDFYLSLTLKDGKYRYELTDVECAIFIGDNKRSIEAIYQDFLDGKRKKIYGLSLKSIDKKVQSLLTSLKSQMAKSISSDGF